MIAPHWLLTKVDPGNTKGESITVPLTSCLTGLESADNFRFYLQNRLIQTSKTGGQQYSDISPFSIPWLIKQFLVRVVAAKKMTA